MSKQFDATRYCRFLDRRSLLRFFIAGTSALILRTTYAQKADQAGSVEEVKGEAFAETGSERRQLDRAAPLFIKDKVGTGTDARATLLLGKATTLHMGENTTLTIDRFLANAGGEVTLQSGPILFDGPSSNARMQIRSAFGLIAVRGTRFFAGPSNDVFGVFVVRGSVSVSAAGKRVLVRSGQGTNIAQPGAQPTPPAPWKPERVQAALASVL
jgi:ferric-dicitrate binding protein FerR (iron transport regulator)